MFARNEGNFDRIIRGALGIVLLGVAFLVLTGVGQWIAGIVGFVLLVTGATGICPAYNLFGVNTCGMKSNPGSQG